MSAPAYVLPAVGEVICDGFRVSEPPGRHPGDSPVERAVREALLELGLYREYATPESSVWRLPDCSGAWKKSARANAVVNSFSGQFVGRLRQVNRLPELLGSIQHAHQLARVVLVDIARDYARPGHLVVPALFRRWQRNGYRLGRKRGRKPLHYLNAPDPEGRRSGTLYAPGIRHRDAVSRSARVYDKRAELHDVHGIAIPPRTRVEVRVTGRESRLCLGDVAEPRPLFAAVAFDAVGGPELGDDLSGVAGITRLDFAAWPPQRELSMNRKVERAVRSCRSQFELVAELVDGDSELSALALRTAMAELSAAFERRQAQNLANLRQETMPDIQTGDLPDFTPSPEQRLSAEGG